MVTKSLKIWFSLITFLAGGSLDLSAHEHSVAPAVTAVSPSYGSVDLNTTIQITGSNFQSGAVVRIGQTAVTTVTVAAASITATVSYGLTAGTYDVTVTNPDGQSGVLAGGFEVVSSPNEWTKVTLIGLPKPITSTCTILLPDNQTYRMYFTSSGAIRSYTSTDGVNWANGASTGITDIGGTNPSVIRLKNGTYLMIYGIQTTNPMTERLYRATSTDGITFTKQSGTQSGGATLIGASGENDFVSVPDLVYLNDTTLRLYFVAGTGASRIHTATSTDNGQTWTREGQISITGGPYGDQTNDPDVVRLADGTWRLFFATPPSGQSIGSLRIRTATSTDGRNFTLESGTRVSPWGSFTVTMDPDAVLAIGSTNSFRVNYGVEPSGDLQGLVSIPDIPSQPTLLSPASGTTSVAGGGNLKWNSTARAMSYRLQISTSSSFSSTLTDTTGITDTSYTLSGLRSNTSYYWRVSASNAAGTSPHSIAWIFTTAPAPPIVTTGTAGPSDTHITFYGTVDPNGVPATYYFQYGTTTSLGSQTAADSTGTNVVSVSVTVSGLTPATTYYYRLAASNSSGTSFGQTLLINTLPSPPTVTTGSATSITTTSALLSGTVNPNGGSTVYWFVYGTTTGYGTQTANMYGGLGSAAINVSYTLNGLSAGTVYHYRIEATNPGGFTQGTDVSFTTLPMGPTATTDAATNITTTSAQLHATVNPNGVSTTCFFEYGVTSSYGSQTSSFSVGSGSTSSSVDASLVGLTPGSTYHYRIVATSAAGTSRGNDLQFQTSALPVTLSLPTVTAVRGDQVTIPISVTGFNHVGLISVTINFDKAAGAYSGLTGAPAGTSSTSVTAANLNGSVSIGWYSANPLNIGTGDLLNLVFTLNGDSCLLSFATAASSICDSAGSNLAVTYTNGKISRSMGVDVGGTVTYCASSTPVNAATVTLTLQGGDTKTAQSSSSGTYIFHNVSPGVYTLSSTKTGAHPTASVNAADALKAALYPTNTSVIPTSLAQSAADVNNDGTVNAADALQIMLRYVGTLASFTKGDWILVPAQSTLSVGTTSVTNDIQAIAVGDVNMDASPSSGTFFSKTEDGAPSLFPAVCPGLHLNSGDVVDVTVRVPAAVGIGSISILCRYPAESATFQGATGPEGMVSGVKDGVVAVAWYRAERMMNLRENDVLLGLRFKGVECGKEFTLAFDRSCDLTDDKGTRLSGLRLDVTADVQAIPVVYAVGQNYPNPFNPRTTIQYQLPAPAHVSLKIFNIVGQLVATLVDERKEAGRYLATWTAEMSSGVYFYRIQAGGYVETRKMVLLQ